MLTVSSSPDQLVAERLQEFLRLEAGWLGDDGDPFDPDALNWLTDAWLRTVEGKVPTPYVYPTPDGGVCMEWPMGHFEVHATIDLKSKNGEITEFGDGRTGIISETQVNLAHEEGWNRLIEFVTRRCDVG